MSRSAVFPPFYSEFGKNLPNRRGRLHQHRVPLPGHRRHHDRRRHPDRPRQHLDHAQPRRRPGQTRGHDPGACSSRPQRVARRLGDCPPGGDHRGRCHRRRWRGRHQGRSRALDSRGRAGQTHPTDRIRQPVTRNDGPCAVAHPSCPGWQDLVQMSAHAPLLVRGHADERSGDQGASTRVTLGSRDRPLRDVRLGRRQQPSLSMYPAPQLDHAVVPVFLALPARGQH